MKTLHILRHAKSDEDDDGDDHGRPLSKRGQKAAARMAEHMTATGFAVDQVYCSTAQRTRQTYEAIAGALGGASVAFRDELYLADVKPLLAFVRDLPAAANAVLLIGHNPGLHMLAMQLARTAVRESDLAVLREKFPTGALCTIAFDVASWREARTGTMLDFIRPRDFE